MEFFCIGFLALWLGILGFALFQFVTKGFRGTGLGAKVVHEEVSLRAHSSGIVKTDVSVVTTKRADAPIGLAFVQRSALSIAGAGANLTRDQALEIARWLREAAAAGKHDG